MDDGWVNRKTDWDEGWMDGWMNGWANRWMGE